MLKTLHNHNNHAATSIPQQSRLNCYTTPHHTHHTTPHTPHHTHHTTPHHTHHTTPHTPHHTAHTTPQHTTPHYQLNVNEHRRGHSLAEWVPFIQSARNPEETNMAASIRSGHVFIIASRHIPAGSELLVWYDEDYADVLKIPHLDETAYYSGW